MCFHERRASGTVWFDNDATHALTTAVQFQVPEVPLKKPAGTDGIDAIVWHYKHDQQECFKLATETVNR